MSARDSALRLADGWAGGRAGSVKVRLAGLAVALGVAAAGVYWALRPPDPAPPGRAEEAPSSVFRGVELVHQDPDGTSWRLAAREGAVRETEASGWLRGVTVELESAGKTVRLDAAEAEFREGVEIRLSGGVEIAWRGYRAQVDQAVYDREDGSITSADPVSLRGPGLAVRGRGVEVDVQGRAARVKSEVSAVVGGGAP